MNHFGGSKRVLAPKYVLEGILVGFYAIFSLNMASTRGPRWLEVGPKTAIKTMQKPSVENPSEEGGHVGKATPGGGKWGKSIPRGGK